MSTDNTVYINSNCMQDIRLFRDNNVICVCGSSSFLNETRQADDFQAHVKFLAKKFLQPGEKIGQLFTFDDSTKKEDFFMVEGN